MAYDYGAKEPEKLKIKDMTPRQKELLIDSDTFCMMPWLHIHAFPDGRAYPCCFALDKYPVGDLNKNSMAEVFNNEDMKGIRKNMLANKASKHCTKCYDQEKSGFFSLRLSSNKHFGHNIGMVDNTRPDGSADFVIKYWDIRFSNLCNLACRSCGTWFSSNWYEDHKKLTGKPPNHAKIMKVGRSSDDIWQQMLEHQIEKSCSITTAVNNCENHTQTASCSKRFNYSNIHQSRTIPKQRNCATRNNNK